MTFPSKVKYWVSLDSLERRHKKIQVGQHNGHSPVNDAIVAIDVALRLVRIPEKH